jgi:hypothetical protein
LWAHATAIFSIGRLCAEKLPAVLPRSSVLLLRFLSSVFDCVKGGMEKLKTLVRSSMIHRNKLAKN